MREYLSRGEHAASSSPILSRQAAATERSGAKSSPAPAAAPTAAGQPLLQARQGVLQRALGNRGTNAVLSRSGPGATPAPGAAPDADRGKMAAEALRLAMKGSERRLPYLETLKARFPGPLEQVRCFFGREAAEACRMMGAEAFAVKDVLVFSCDSPSLSLVAHELAHVMQQGGLQQKLGSAPGKLEVSAAGGVMEQQAEQRAREATRPDSAPPTPASAAGSKEALPGEDTQQRAFAEGEEQGEPVLARVPSPPDCHTYEPGLSPVQPIVKQGYDGKASTTIVGGWCTSSWERRWEVYDADDQLLHRSSYTLPQPTLTVTKEMMAMGRAGGEESPWSIWIKVTKTLVPLGGSNPSNFPHSVVTFPVYETQEQRDEAEESKALDPQAKEDAALLKVFGVTSKGPASSGSLTGASGKVTPEVAFKILENMSKGEPPFKPELGKGGCSWFVSEGNPHTGIDAGKTVPVPVEVAKPGSLLIFDEAALDKIYSEVKPLVEAEAEAKYRSYKGIPPTQQLTSKQQKGLARLIKTLTESRMWDEVGKQVSKSPTKVGEVVLQGSKYSVTGNGKFLVVADAGKITVKGGVPAMVTALEGAGLKAEPVVVEAAEVAAKRLKWVGKVQTAFRWGGRILIVVAVAADAYKIYHATDKVKAVVECAGGWGGAIASSSIFAAYFAPGNAAGPWAWAAYGAGILISGGVGYWIGSETTRFIYELVVEE